MDFECGVNVPQCHRCQQIVPAKPFKIGCRKVICGKWSQGEFLGLVPSQRRQRYLHGIHTMEAPFSRPSCGLNGFKQWVPMQTIFIIMYIAVFPMGRQTRSKRRRSLGRRLPVTIGMVLPIEPVVAGPRSRHGWTTQSFEKVGLTIVWAIKAPNQIIENTFRLCTLQRYFTQDFVHSLESSRSKHTTDRVITCKSGRFKLGTAEWKPRMHVHQWRFATLYGLVSHAQECPRIWYPMFPEEWIQRYSDPGNCFTVAKMNHCWSESDWHWKPSWKIAD